MATATRPLSDLVCEKEFSGLAVIVTNDYSSTGGYDPLHGTARDGEKLRAAFERFNFFVYNPTNVNLDSLQLIIREMASLDFSLVKNYICIAFVFSGHGIDSDRLVLQDAELVSITEIVNKLLPGSSKALATIPKVFLIDCCRGSEDTGIVVVPRGNRKSPPGQLTARGGRLLDQMTVPAEGNFLMAYSTMPNHKAFEDKESGGRWFSILAEHMQQLDVEKSLEDILTEVNESMMDMLQDDKDVNHYQQPEKHSRLNKKIVFNPKCIGMQPRRDCGLLQ